MALVNMKKMLEKAKEEKYAVGQFNINNLEWTKTILTVAEEMNAPVILGVSKAPPGTWAVIKRSRAWSRGCLRFAGHRGRGPASGPRLEF